MDLARLEDRADPSFQALAAPVGWLCKELACRTSPRFMVMQCVAKASEVQKGEAEKRPGKSCMRCATGPVSTAMAAARTIGWTHVADFAWSAAGGEEGIFATAAPDSVKFLAERDVKKHLWEKAASRHAHLAHLEGAPYLDAARELLEDGGGLSKKQRGLLKAFLAGAFFRSTECTCGQTFDDPMSWWAHFVWACPNTQAGREYLKLPQHEGKHSLDGLDDGFMDRIVQYLHLPWVQTAVLPDPRARAPGPATPEIIKWQVPEGYQALFAGECFGDGACGRRGPVEHRRAGWAVGEAYLHLGRAGAFRIGRNAAGTLPGHLQSPEGAEQYCLVFWLRHLDP